MHPASGPVRGNGLAAEADFSLNSRQPPGLFDTISARNSASVRLAGNSSYLAQLMGHHGVYIKGQPILWGVDSDDFIASCVLVVLALVIPFLARRSASSTRQSLRNKLDAGDESVYKSVLVKLPESFFDSFFFDFGLCISVVLLKLAVDILYLPVIGGIDTAILAVVMLKIAFFVVACNALFKVLDACHQVLTERYAAPIGLVDIFNSVTSPIMLIFKTVLAMLIFVCVAGLLARTGDNMSSMFMSFISVCTLGAFGFMGLAFKGIAQEYQSAVDIITEGLFKKDDEIEIQCAGRNLRGRVVTVETRITRILTNDGVLATIPNNTIPSSIVVNHSARKFTQVSAELLVSQKCKMEE
jgi:small-conductance mechanosensitive channel